MGVMIVKKVLIIEEKENPYNGRALGYTAWL